MIGVLAATEARSGSPRWCWSPRRRATSTTSGYRGGFSAADIDELLESLDANYLGWSAAMAPVIMGNPERPELGEELTNSFCRTDPGIARVFARATFLSDNRGRPGAGTGADAGRSQCSRTRSPRREVGAYVHAADPGQPPGHAGRDGTLPAAGRPGGHRGGHRRLRRSRRMTCGTDAGGAGRAPVRAGGAEEAVFSALLEDSAEDLYEHAPCGYLSTLLDGTIAKVNATLLDWLGYRRRTWWAAGGSPTCSPSAASSTTRPTSHRCCACRARSAGSHWSSGPPTAAGCRCWSPPR